MPDTGIIGPLSNAAVGTGLGDGTTYGSFSFPQRLHRTAVSSNASTVTAAGKGSRWYNCFNLTQIPTGATITGVEIVSGVDFDGSGNSYIGTFGSTGATEGITFKAFLYNGSAYSSALTYDGIARSGITYANGNTEATFTGGNKSYLGSSTLGTLFGSNSTLSGLTWDPSSQASFGFAIITTAVTATPVAGIIRGIGLKVTYTEGTIAEKLNTVISGSISKLDTIVGNTIAKFNGIILNGAPPPTLFSSTLYSFENQSTQENAGGSWVVSTPMSDSPAWVNGTSAVDGTFWGLTSNKTVKGWNLGQDTTSSSGTGPSGGATLPSGTPSTLTGQEKYMYTESSSGRSAYCFVCRTGAYNFSTSMIDTSNNLDLEFFVHGYSSSTQMGDLFTYIDTATTSNNTSATLLDSQTSFSQTSNGSNYTKITVSLNSYRTVNSDHYIYFVSQNGSGFRSDLAVDLVQIKESTP
tara:strand:+ start:4585 stop:5982 length:1398 start_codon:yes stop_codon:yes gene_type:complete